jgi:tetratricopeptide (TPR) repeat protein
MMFVSGVLLLPFLCGGVAPAEIDTAALLDRIGFTVSDVPRGAPWSSQAHARSARALISGREAHYAGDLQESFNAYRQAVKADPANEAAWLGLARLAGEAGDRGLEIEAWRHRLELCPTDTEAIAVAAELAMFDGRNREALILLLRRAGADSAGLDPIAEVRWDLALGVRLPLVDESAAGQALVHKTRARLMDLAVHSPGDRSARNRWAWLLQRLVIENAREIARDAAEARLVSGQLTHPADRGRFTSACIVMDALDGDAARTASLIRSLPADDLRLRLHFRQPMQPAEMWLNAAIVHSSLGNKQGGMDLLEEAIRLDGQLPMALNNLGYMLLEQGTDQDRAAELIEHAYELNPEDAGTLDSLGLLRIRQGRLEDDTSGRGAIGVLREAVRQSDNLDPIILEHLGDAEEAAGQHEAARRSWRQALALLTHQGFQEDKIRIWDVVQTGDWGIRVRPSSELYDLEFGGATERLRGRLGVVEELSN